MVFPRSKLSNRMLPSANWSIWAPSTYKKFDYSIIVQQLESPSHPPLWRLLLTMVRCLEATVLVTFSTTMTHWIHLANTTSYTSTLTASSSTYSRTGFAPGFFFEALRVTVSVTGEYDIRSISNIDAYGSLYRSAFNPSNPMGNLVIQDDSGGGRGQFRITATLQAGVTYILVFTTYAPNEQGPFTVSVTGPTRVGLARIGGSSAATTSASTASPSTTSTRANPTTCESNITLTQSL